MTRDDLRWFCIDLIGGTDFPDSLTLVDLTNRLVRHLVHGDDGISRRVAPCLTALLCVRYGFEHTNCVSVNPGLSKMVLAIQILHGTMPQLRNGSTIDSLSEGCCPPTNIPHYESMLRLYPTSLAAQVLYQQLPADHLGQYHSSAQTLFQKAAGACTPGLRKVEFANEFFYYDRFRTRLSKWIMFYLYHKNGQSVSSVWTTGNIVSRRIFGAIGGLRHLGIVVGHIGDIVFIVDLDTTKRRCSRVAVKTLAEFGAGVRVSVHRDVNRKGCPKRQRIPVEETLDFLYQSIGNDLKYSFLQSSDCDSFATFAGYGVRMCNQRQLPTHKIHETIPYSHPNR